MSPLKRCEIIVISMAVKSVSVLANADRCLFLIGLNVQLSTMISCVNEAGLESFRLRASPIPTRTTHASYDAKKRKHRNPSSPDKDPEYPEIGIKNPRLSWTT